MPHFIVNSILIWVGILGLFVMYLMLFSYISNKLINAYLVVIFALCSIRNIIFGFADIFSNGLLLNQKFVNPSFLLAAPCLFLYFKSLVKDYRKFHKEDLLHFIYPCIILVLNLVQVYLHTLKHQLIEDIRFVTVVTFFILYIILSYKVLSKNLWKQNCKHFVDSRHDGLINDWTRFIFIISSLMFLRIIYSICVEKLSNEPLQAYRFSIVTVVPWLLIYGRILITPEILYGYPRFKKRTMKDQEVTPINDRAWIYDEGTISNFQKEILKCNIKKRVLFQIIALESFIYKNNPFRNTNLSLHNFANFLELPTSHLHYIFKYHSVMSFEEYKFSCMANDAKKIIDDGDIYVSSLESLSFKVGFKDYVSFENAFKELTGRSPEEYLEWKKWIEKFELMPYV